MISFYIKEISNILSPEIDSDPIVTPELEGDTLRWHYNAFCNISHQNFVFLKNLNMYQDKI